MGCLSLTFAYRIACCSAKTEHECTAVKKIIGRNCKVQSSQTISADTICDKESVSQYIE